MRSSRKNDPFEIREYRVREDDGQYMDDLPMDDYRIDEQEDVIERIRSRERAAEPKKKNEYGWAFFLFFLFTGIGITATIGHPLPLFMGMATGFLFFVDPIYQAVMRSINRI